MATLPVRPHRKLHALIPPSGGDELPAGPQGVPSGNMAEAEHATDQERSADAAVDERDRHQRQRDNAICDGELGSRTRS